MIGAIATLPLTIAIVMVLMATTPMGVVIILAIMRHGCVCNGHHCQVGVQGNPHQVCVVTISRCTVCKSVCSVIILHVSLQSRTYQLLQRVAMDVIHFTKYSLGMSTHCI